MLILLLVLSLNCNSQFKSWTENQIGYWYYSQQDAQAYQAICHIKQIKYLPIYLILPLNDTIPMTQVNDRLKPIRDYGDIRYLGSGKADHTEITKDAIFIHFKYFNRTK